LGFDGAVFRREGRLFVLFCVLTWFAARLMSFVRNLLKKVGMKKRQKEKALKQIKAFQFGRGSQTRTDTA
jgi:hypothetical protein